MSIILIVNPKCSTVPVIKKKINTIPAEAWTAQYCIYQSYSRLEFFG